MYHKTIALLLIINIIFAQVSIKDVQGLSNKELNDLRKELKSSPVKSSTSNEELDINEIKPSEVVIKASKPTNNSNYFGYNYFTKDINFFDNTPTPDNYNLGPGDEIILSLWGETNSRQNFIINRDGLIYYENIGFINVSNKTISEVELILINELSSIYSTLTNENNPTKLKIELGRLKSINVFFTGQAINPGINLIHPFSDIYSALIQAGGIKQNGSLRSIQLIRDNKIISEFDFYNFFLSGEDSFSNIRLFDGDIIHIPVINNRVKITGEITQPGFYELLSSSTVDDLINFAGGLKSSASQRAIIREIVPSDNRISDDIARTGRIINQSKFSETFLENGSEINFQPIASNDISIDIYGRVNYPGKYPIYQKTDSLNGQSNLKKSSLKDILDLAGGFDDPIYRKSIDDEIVVMRLNENNYFSDEYVVNYKDAKNFKLEINDKIFVYENSNYNNGFVYTIKGEVNRPGTYALKDNLTLNDAIETAGGITELGTINNVIVKAQFLGIDADEVNYSNDEVIKNVDINFIIRDKNEITILPKTNVFKIEGNVYNPGLIAHNGKKISIRNAVELGGGYKPNTLKNRVYIKRSNGEIEKANSLFGKSKRVYPGDAVFVPIDPEPSDFDITDFLADISSTLANIAAILVIADNNN